VVLGAECSQIVARPSRRNPHVAQDKKRQIEYKLVTGGLQRPSRTPIKEFVEGFCQHLESIRTRKLYKNDGSVLRTLFGAVCSSLTPGNT
jgi:hypothetical protein